METVAAGWNEGDARRAADCFNDDAIYMEPPDKQMYHGRQALYQLFGGGKKQQSATHLSWHHLAFDAPSQIGFGEYTFATMNHQYHGVAVVKIASGKIASWREYQYRSDLSWQLFAGRGYF